MLHQLKSFPNQLTLLRLAFIPFIAMEVVGGDYLVALGLLVLAGLSDLFDGMLARRLNQRTTLGQYLDPIADKLLLSTMFLVLAATHKVPWRITILVFSRDFSILLVSLLLYLTTSLRDYSPSFFGKANTGAQIFTVIFVLLNEVHPAGWVDWALQAGIACTATLTVVSGVHYIWLVGQRLRAPAAVSIDRSKAA